MNQGNSQKPKALVIGNHQQIVRVDLEEEQMILTAEQEDAINRLISEKIQMVDCVIISDYGKGFCTEKICQHAIHTAGKLGKTTIVNPKRSDWGKYEKATIINPNLKEIAEASGKEMNNNDDEPKLIQTDKTSSSKVINREQLLSILQTIRKDKKIVFTNGVFDVIHKGHIYYLQKARQLGDILIVGLNSDSSVKRIKGEGRPINNETDRAFVLSAFGFVDYIVLFSTDTPIDLIQMLQPDVLVKGADYKIEAVIGREFAKETVLIDFQAGYSSTTLINKGYKPK